MTETLRVYCTFCDVFLGLPANEDGEPDWRYHKHLNRVEQDLAKSRESAQNEADNCRT